MKFNNRWQLFYLQSWDTIPMYTWFLIDRIYIITWIESENNNFSYTYIRLRHKTCSMFEIEHSRYYHIDSLLKDHEYSKPEGPPPGMCWSSLWPVALREVPHQILLLKLGGINSREQRAPVNRNKNKYCLTLWNDVCRDPPCLLRTISHEQKLIPRRKRPSCNLPDVIQT